MADDSSQEKTEEPTGRKLQKAREEGQVPRSKELSTFVVLIAGALALLIFGQYIGNGMGTLFEYSFELSRDEIFDDQQPIIHLENLVRDAAITLAPFMVIMILASFIGPTGLGGFNFATKALIPKPNRLDPVQGVKKLFSLNSLVELGKGILKTLVIGACAVLIFYIDIPEIRALRGEAIEVAVPHAIVTIAWSFFWLACSLIFIVIVDVPFQIFNHKKELRMTKQEVKDEFKDIEGKPEVKRRIRQVQFEMAQKRMMEAVPEADVVITNPTHYSVALKYDAESMGAPLVIAKGIDHLALKIREIAKAHKIEIVEAPPLTRAVYHHSEVGQEIPSSLYLAVAQVLAYVFQLRRYRSGYGQKPGEIPSFEIPPNMRRDQ